MIAAVGTGAVVLSLGTATPAVLELPADVAAGDLLLAVVTVRQSTATIGTPGGWTHLGSWTRASLNQLAIFWRIAAADEAAVAVNVVAGSSSTIIAQAFAFRGVDVDAPFGVIGDLGSFGAAASIGPIPGITLSAGNLVVVLAHQGNDWDAVDTLVGDGLDWVELSEPTTMVGGDAGLVVDVAVAGTADVVVTPKTFVVTGAGNASIGLMLELRAAAPLPPVDELVGGDVLLVPGRVTILAVEARTVVVVVPARPTILEVRRGRR